MPRGAAFIHLGRPLPHGSSSLPEDLSAEADTGTGNPRSPYSALLRMGFTVPSPSPERRCALTAPFHPYLRPARRRSTLCGTFPRVATAGCYPACHLSWSPDLPLRLSPQRTPTSSSNGRIPPYYDERFTLIVSVRLFDAGDGVTGKRTRYESAVEPESPLSNLHQRGFIVHGSEAPACLPQEVRTEEV